MHIKKWYNMRYKQSPPLSLAMDDFYRPRAGIGTPGVLNSMTSTITTNSMLASPKHAIRELKVRAMHPEYSVAVQKKHMSDLFKHFVLLQREHLNCMVLALAIHAQSDNAYRKEFSASCQADVSCLQDELDQNEQRLQDLASMILQLKPLEEEYLSAVDQFKHAQNRRDSGPKNEKFMLAYNAKVHETQMEQARAAFQAGSQEILDAVVRDAAACLQQYADRSTAIYENMLKQLFRYPRIQDILPDIRVGDQHDYDLSDV